MEIFERIAREAEVAGATLADESAVSRPTISHHLKELSTVGLIKPRKEAKFRFYRVNRRVWGSIYPLSICLYKERQTMARPSRGRPHDGATKETRAAAAESWRKTVYQSLMI